MAWTSRQRLSQLKPAALPGFWHLCPDFVIELKSESDCLRVLRAKMREWIDNGGKLAWLVNPENRTRRNLPSWAEWRDPPRTYYNPRDSQDARLVAIINDAFASQFLRGKDAIGQSVWLGAKAARPVEIIGVVAGIRGSDLRAGQPQIYVPFAQDPSSYAYFMVRQQSTSGVPADPIQRLPEVRRRIAAIDPRQPLFDAKTLDDRLNEVFAPFRIISGMLVWFGLLALTLASVGVYGVVSFSVAQRTREIGIRAALGAGRARLLRMFLRQGLSILATGLAPGLLGGFAAAFGLRSIFAEVLPANFVPQLLFAAAIIGCAVLIATLVPARKAASVDPLAAIRYE